MFEWISQEKGEKARSRLQGRHRDVLCLIWPLLGLSFAIPLISLTTFISFSISISAGTVSAEPHLLTEEEARSAVLLNFAKYSERLLPGDDRTPTEERICIWGNTVDAQIALLSSRNISGIPVTVRAVTSVVEASGCDLLFFDKRSVGNILTHQSALQNLKLLIVSEGVSTAPIQFDVTSGTITFECNPERANDSGFRFSSQMLKLSKRLQ